MKKAVTKLILTVMAAFLFLMPLSFGYKLNKQEITAASVGGNFIVPWSHSNEYNAYKEKNISFYGGGDDVYVPW
ncbi:hypothetical protein WJ0W_004954 [Paenibacillus melissococcoides]|uniref:Uncharacterized protein n=1 Tax=Paenibacillus melissococcoides TaxID=2912268 RepID=A0ABN8U9D6_9BACL|nr:MULTISPECIES: hypothetical protein [Paenibacillus]MEB9894457.1 hypothetical protein [Bacillus cereus]CAH8247698.1 hypothetical protein WJ0W_004954 [Paenibacillus melissococcoides]CAH8705698.1 hypothetical protein HTL2_001036 [Paenibacillus melissococcoides]CAH8715171.1 hypothetical protein WDD9_004156 [Paenibacillus melissococcoides]GIO81183.1 hypothetical protein J6TS7_47930 [Paenibacillus dendritiformis]